MHDRLSAVAPAIEPLVAFVDRHGVLVLFAFVLVEQLGLPLPAAPALVTVGLLAAKGHVSLTTTNVYAEVDLQMKAKALASCEIKDEKEPDKPWREDKGLMEFLRTL